ncbi:MULTISPECIES: glycine cleavage T C-terminal barrel domain-containing protein [unclassified Mesorhizobium]|uniref:glycine cleavage T C-terminal barrel domain-containing protein n=1 Tax=unclassified Mesorhizobium TaxID=325217 RepID=UPI001FEFAA2E|nr:MULTISPECIES: glycine cleavage T C-terminal barrel domain-containing protein [unclassified Mesorhizobium]
MKSEAALKKNQAGARRTLVTLEIDAEDADASGYELVWNKGKLAGFVTSGGYGHTVGKSLAMALVDRDAADADTQLTTHIVGIERDALRRLTILSQGDAA